MTSNANVSVTDTTQILPKIWVTQSTWKRAYQLVLLCSDALMLLLAFALAYWLRFYGGIPVFEDVVPSIEHYLRLVTILIPV